MTKNELIAKLIVLGFKPIYRDTYTLIENNGRTYVHFLHNEHIRVNINYPTLKGIKDCTYDKALLWICEHTQ